MIHCNIIAGDSAGGPHAKVEIGFDRESAEDMKDGEVERAVEGVRDLFMEAFDHEPQAMVVWFDEHPEAP